MRLFLPADCYPARIGYKFSMNTMWKSTVILLLCSFVGGLIMTVGWWFRAPELLPGAALAMFTVTAFLTLEYFVKGHRLVESVSAWVSIVTIVTFTGVICFNHDYYVRTNLPFEPFIGIKVIALLLPFVCPPKRWVGFSSAGLLIVLPLHKYLSWDVNARASLGIQEPYVTVTVVAVAGIVYHYRLRLLETLEAEVRAEARAKSLQQFANMLIASQHLINTPLQKIELLCHLILEKHPDAASLSRQFEVNFDVIRRVTRVLSFTDEKTKWDSLTLPQDASQLENQVKQVFT